MQLPSFFRNRKPKSFDFKPRYFNERKDYIETRKKLVESEMKAESEGKDLAYSFKDAWRKNHRTQHIKKSNTRIALIAGVLALIFYLILK